MTIKEVGFCFINNIFYTFASKKKTHLKIAVNTRLLLPNKLEGIGWFSYEILKRMVASHPEDEFLFIFDRPYDKKFIFGDNVHPIVIGPPARHPVLFKIWFDWSVTSILKKHKPDIFLSPDGYLSLRTDVPSVAVIHDLNFEHYPKDLKSSHSKYYRKNFPLFAKKAKRIVTVSNFSKNDISKLYNISPSKIDVVYNGVGDGFFPIDSATIAKVKNKYSNKHDYFLFVGALHPRKNIGRLLRAFDTFKIKTKKTVKLIIVGEKYWWNDNLKTIYEGMKYSEEVVFTGRKNQEELNQIYGASLALCFVPYFEGFGIPILEGFKSETAVITSNITSMPEVAGDAGCLVDPFNIESIAQAMIALASNEFLRQEYIKKGQKRVLEFSWDKSAKKMYEILKKTTDG